MKPHVNQKRATSSNIKRTPRSHNLGVSSVRSDLKCILERLHATAAFGAPLADRELTARMASVFETDI